MSVAGSNPRVCSVAPQAVRDVTGREDLVRHLRDQLIADTARRLGCTKVARGDCANTLAMRIISDTAKVAREG